MNLEELKADVPLSTAQAAHCGTSFVPERRAKQEQDGYAETLLADYEELKKHANTDEKLVMLDDEFARYREGYRKRNMAYLHSRSRLVSVMIAGPSNFPAARMNKRGDISHKRLTELLEFRERALQAIRRKLRPELRPIMAGDADAVERLEVKIRAAERQQEAMKQANQIVRRKPKNESTPEKLAELMTLGLKEHNAREMFNPDFCGRLGFPDYALQNNNANIQRMKKRLDSIVSAKATPASEVDGANARIDDCPDENRIKLFFPGKPEATVRDTLKRSGFRWSPTNGCWQAYRNSRSQAVAREVAGVQL